MRSARFGKATRAWMGVMLALAISAPLSARQAAAPRTQEYVIGADDVLSVSFWRDKDLSSDAVVRPDGFISLPLLNDVRALGLTPTALAAHLKELAAAYLEDPTVTVVVKQINSRKVFVTGEVVKPGQYALSGQTTVLQLLAMAGGLTAFANAEEIAIIRVGDAGPVTFRFNYKNAARLKDLRDNIILMPGDTVVVS